MSAPLVQRLAAGSAVQLVAAVYGENWIIGDQDWVPLAHAWERVWYQLQDGSYVYRPFVMLASDGPSARDSGERYVVIDLDQQTAWAMEGDIPVRAMAVTTGEPEFATPVGEFRVQARVESERMTSASAGFGADEHYDVQRVLFTQYFAAGGFALHLNYWQPNTVFGNYPTSHGCVGLQLADAQFLWLFGAHGMRVIIRESGGATPAPPLPTPTPIPTPGPIPSLTASPSATPPLATPNATETPTPVPASLVPSPSSTTTATATPTPTPVPTPIASATPG
jgi:hypothetical protein